MNAPSHEVGAAGEPVAAVIAILDPQVLVELAGGVLLLDVVGPVLEAEEIAGSLLLDRRR